MKGRVGERRGGGQETGSEEGENSREARAATMGRGEETEENRRGLGLRGLERSLWGGAGQKLKNLPRVEAGRDLQP